VRVSAVAADLLERANSHRSDLLGYCYRFLGSDSEAEDAVQETLARAWDRAEQFRGESALRTWLYKVAVRVCIDMSRAPQRRALPMDLRGRGTMGTEPDLGTTLSQDAWVWPMPDDRLPGPAADPAELVSRRDTIRLAFVAALQHLPPRQRAVLILRDVLAFSAQETAQVLEISVDAVTSALNRARSTMRERNGEPPAYPGNAVEQEMVDRYVAAFEAYDVDRLVSLLATDATFSMPPMTFWLQGTADIEAWWRGPGGVCRDSRILRGRLNGRPALGFYHPAGEGRWEPFAVHVLEVTGSGIADITHFHDSRVFAELGMPEELVETDQFRGLASSK
jgi:RNA polymerase sigma-70 factor (ECF subfamily)